MAELVAGQDVRVDWYKTDRWGRLIGTVWVGAPECRRDPCAKTLDAGLQALAALIGPARVPVGVSLVLGVSGVIGLLVGGLASGFVLAVFLSNSAGAWDNAKKYIESGHHGGKSSAAHRASVIGDTVGDPFKDTSGRSLNILIKLMSIVSIVMAGVTVSFSLLRGSSVREPRRRAGARGPDSSGPGLFTISPAPDSLR